MTCSCTLVMVAALAASLAAGPATAETDKFAGVMQKKFDQYCAKTKAPTGEKFAERLTGRLDLKDAQKPALNELRDAFAKSMTDAKTALCGTKPDFSNTPGRFAFAKSRIEGRLDRMKTIEPKLQAFYKILDDAQKVKFDELHLWARARKTGTDNEKNENDSDDH